MKNQISRTMALVVLAVAPALAQTTPDEGTITITPLAFSTDYMFRGVRNGGFSYQPAVEFSKGPWELALYTNLLISDKDVMGTNNLEMDWVASYTWNIVPDAFTIKPGVTAYHYPRAKKDEGAYNAVFEPSLSFGSSLGDVNLSLNLYYDLVQKGPTYEFAADYTINIASGLDLELAALAGKYDWSDLSPVEENVKASGNYFQAGVTLPYEFSKRSVLKAGWYFSKGYYFDGDGSKTGDLGKGVFTLSYSYTF